MATKISGTVEDETGSAIDGATVYVIEESTNSVAAVTTSDSVGSFEVTGLSDTETYHVGAQYDDGSTKYAGESYPFVEPFTELGPIDDFEDGEIDEYSGDKVSFSVQNSVVQEGTNALQMSNDDGASNEIRSTSGLPRYPSEGDTFSFRVYFENSDSAAEMHFGVQDSDNYYRARIIPSVGEISLGKYVSGSLTNLDTDFGSIPTGEWLEGIIEWNTSVSPPEISFTLNDSAQTEIAATSPVQDGEFSSGGIGWDASVDSFSGDSVYFDIAELGATTDPSIKLIDDFNDADLVEYSIFESDGTVTLSTATVFEGSHAAEFRATKGNVGISSHPNSSNTDLPNYPSAGDTFEFHVNVDRLDSAPEFFFFTADETYRPDGFRVKINSRHIQLENAATGETLAATGIDTSFYTGQWLRIEANAESGGDITIRLYDSSDNLVAQLQRNDSSHSSGGISLNLATFDSVTTNEKKAFWDMGQITGAASNETVTEQVIGDFNRWYLFVRGQDSWEPSITGGTAAELIGASWVTDSKIPPYAVDFDGTDDLVEIKKGSVLTSAPYTVGCWVKSTGATGTFRPLYAQNNPDKNTLVLDIDIASDDTIRFNTPDARAFSTGTVPESWSHVVVTLTSGGDLDFYINGSASGSASVDPALSSGYDPASSAIGAINRSSSVHANVTIDGFRIYNRVLSSSEVSQWYNNTV